MDTITLTKDELKDIVHESVQETLSELLFNEEKREEFLELIEDLSLGRLMEEGRTGSYVDADEFIMELGRKIKG